MFYLGYRIACFYTLWSKNNPTFSSVILAEAIPKLGLFISLVGAVSSTALALVFPPIIEMIVCWHNTNLGFCTIAKDVMIVLIGVLGFATGTYESMTAIINSFSNWIERASDALYKLFLISLSWTRARASLMDHDTYGISARGSWNSRTLPNFAC